MVVGQNISIIKNVDPEKVKEGWYFKEKPSVLDYFSTASVHLFPLTTLTESNLFFYRQSLW